MNPPSWLELSSQRKTEVTSHRGYTDVYTDRVKYERVHMKGPKASKQLYPLWDFNSRLKMLILFLLFWNLDNSHLPQLTL